VRVKAVVVPRRRCGPSRTSIFGEEPVIGLTLLLSLREVVDRVRSIRGLLHRVGQQTQACKWLEQGRQPLHAWTRFSPGIRSYKPPRTYSCSPPQDDANLHTMYSQVLGWKEAVVGPRQTEMIAQSCAFIAAPEYAAALELGHHLVDKVFQPHGQEGKHYVEPITALAG
jgi:hypothetical protein